METQTAVKKKSNRWWIVLLVLITIVVALVLLGQLKNQKDAQASLNSVKTVPYRQETLLTTVNGTGTVRPKRLANLPWKATASIGEVSVSIGQEVKADEILAEFDQDKLPAELLQAELNAISARQALDNLKSGTPTQRAKLESDIATAQKNLDNLNAQLQILEQRQCADYRVDELQRSYDQALEDYRNYPTEAKLAQLQNKLNALNFCKPESVKAQITELKAQIALQEKILGTAQDDLKKIQNGPNPDDLKRLTLQLDLAEKQLEAKHIVAPFDGTVTQLYAKAGDMSMAGTVAAQVADLSELYLDVAISEIDISSIALGQKVELVFDAFYERSFTGVVSDIAQTGNDRAGTVSYPVSILIEDPEGLIKPGMTAGVSIFTAEKPNVYTIPSEAIIVSQDQEYVYVLRNGKPERVPVKTGSYSSSAIEVLQANIKDGEDIILNPPSTIFDRLFSRK